MFPHTDGILDMFPHTVHIHTAVSGHDESFGSIEFGGRTYIPYGTANRKYRKSDIDSCLGYIIQNEHSSSVSDSGNTMRRVYTLAADPDHHFLMDFDDSIRLMNQPSFFRAIDTKGETIDAPDCIDSLGYAFWEE